MIEYKSMAWHKKFNRSQRKVFRIDMDLSGGFLGFRYWYQNPHLSPELNLLCQSTKRITLPTNPFVSLTLIPRW
jgi:hypothetical protein